MDESKIARINELYHKSKEVGLSDAELKEQLILRKEYIDSVRRNLRGQLDNISVKEADGSITNLGEKYGRKKIQGNYRRNFVFYGRIRRTGKNCRSSWT